MPFWDSFSILSTPSALAHLDNTFLFLSFSLSHLSFILPLHLLDKSSQSPTFIMSFGSSAFKVAPCCTNSKKIVCLPHKAFCNLSFCPFTFPVLFLMTPVTWPLNSSDLAPSTCHIYSLADIYLQSHLQKAALNSHKLFVFL